MAYKMKGHSLPGINQRKSPAKAATDPNPEKTQKRITKNTQDNFNKNIQSGITTEQKGPQTPMEKEWEKRTRYKMHWKNFRENASKAANDALNLMNKGKKVKKSPAKQKIDGESQRKIKRKNKQATRIATRHSKAVEKGKDKKVTRLEKKMERKGIQTPKQKQQKYVDSPGGIDSYTGSKTDYARKTPSGMGSYDITPKKKK
tara:strand:- start:304 stop:909 length:606 start_codon:yes stop_codon:yes gene_type:complete